MAHSRSKKHKAGVSTLNKAQKLYKNEHYKESIPLFSTLLQQTPNDPDILNLIGYAFYASKQYDEAIKVLQKLLTLDPNHAKGREILLASLFYGKEYDAMIILAQKIQKAPLNDEEYLRAFSTFFSLCDWDNALPMLNRCVKNALKNTIPAAMLSGFLLETLEAPNISCETIFALATKTAELSQQNIRPIPARKKQPCINNKIKLAYLSSDLYAHPVGYFLYSILAASNKRRFEIFCYSGLDDLHDSVTESIRAQSDHFIDVSNLNEEEIAQRIYNDDIHILVELGGHTKNSKLTVLAYQPAPVSISYLGYPNTTGFSCVDFRITDPYVDCPDGTQYSETLLTLPQSFLCFGMHPSCSISKQAPVNTNGYISFGVFNDTRKFTPQAIEAWSTILKRVKNSRLVCKGKMARKIIGNNILKEFKRYGIGADRITILTYTDTYDDHVACYNDIDIALDTFPYTGTTTTCEALWMGVPVITLVGKSHQSRVSYSILKNIGYEETLSYSWDEYINKAVQLANNPDGLTLLRSMLHTLFKHSPVARTDIFVPALEDLYLKAWKMKMEQPALTMEVETTILNMNGNISIVLPQDLNQISTYVLTEQGDWYEDELRFLRLITKPGMRILDCSAEYGCYSLSLAKEVGSDGAVLALNHEPNQQRAIEESAEKNSFTQLNTGSSNDAPAFLQTGVDIIIHAENGIDSNNICFAIPDTLSPIVMIKAMDENGMDGNVTKCMQQQGFNSYRLVPALNLLVPIPEEFTSTSYHQQIFFCKKDRAEALANDGILLLHELESIDLPDDLTYWQHAIKGRTFADTLLPLWIEQVQEGQTSDDWEQVRNALAAYAMADNKEISSQQRYAYLSAALNILLNTEQLQSSIARLCTLARIASELGNYTTAIQAAQMVHEGITALQHFSPDEPFLPISSCYDQDNYQNDLAEWVLAQSIAQTARLQSPTSFASDHHHLNQINAELCNLEFPDTELKRREKIASRKARGYFISVSEPGHDTPMFSIIIPTRERHDTLKSAIESALNQQDFNDYEIVVMDNMSSKETYQVVQALNNPKIKYFRSTERLTINDNWELALEHSNGEYIFILGDDDALMPDALAIAAALIEKYRIKIIAWEKPVFWWNNSIVFHHKARLYTSLADKTIKILNSRDMLKKFCNFELGYDYLPSIYNSFVHKSIINKVKVIHGRYFMSLTPDVASSILNAYFSEQYCYTSRSLSISGNSKHSGGCNFLWPHLKSDHSQYQSERQGLIEFERDGVKHIIDYGKYENNQITKSETFAMSMAREFLVNKEMYFPEDDQLKIKPDRVLHCMAANINITPHRYDLTIKEIKEMAQLHGLHVDFSQVPEKIVFTPTPIQGFNANSISLSINCEQANIETAAQAAKSVQSLWPDWKAWITAYRDPLI